MNAENSISTRVRNIQEIEKYFSNKIYKQQTK